MKINILPSTKGWRWISNIFSNSTFLSELKIEQTKTLRVSKFKRQLAIFKSISCRLVQLVLSHRTGKRSQWLTPRCKCKLGFWFQLSYPKSWNPYLHKGLGKSNAITVLEYTTRIGVKICSKERSAMLELSSICAHAAATCHVWLLSPWNAANTTDKQILTFYLIRPHAAS